MNILDPLYLLFYVNLITGLVTSNVLYEVISLVVIIVKVIKDYYLQNKVTHNEVLQNQIDELRSELSSIKLQQGIKTLK